MIHSASFTSVTFEVFVEAYLCFQYLPRQENTEVMKFLGILKNMSRRIKYIFVEERKAMFGLIKKLFLSFTRFSNLIFQGRSFTVLSSDPCVLISYFFCSLTSVSKKQDIETMLTFPYSYNWQKFNNKMNEKRSQEYQSMNPEYGTGKINRRILELLLRRFCCLIFAPSQKS